VGTRGSDLRLYEEEARRLDAVLEKLCQDAKARAVFLIEKSGQLITASGEAERLDTTSLASLVAGNIAASGGLAQLLGEKGFNVIFHEGERDHLHLSVVSQRAILVVLFDQRSTLGLVRLRVKRAAEELARIFTDIARRADQDATSAREAFQTQFAQITDEDIDNLFTS
jgi:predicted regulator of Ras-like GTPase activity (Roadblock/LC7/MglB family)